MCDLRFRHWITASGAIKLYSITWSARASSAAGTSMPSVFSRFQIDHQFELVEKAAAYNAPRRAVFKRLSEPINLSTRTTSSTAFVLG
jgi:hypothetical protein